MTSPPGAGPQGEGSVGPTLRSERLVLRPWREDDLGPFAALNADPETMRFFPAPLSRVESDALVERMVLTFAESGMGMWAVEVAGGPAFVGAVGLVPVRFEAPFTPAVEVGWRLAREHWVAGTPPKRPGRSCGSVSRSRAWPRSSRSRRPSTSRRRP